MTAIKNGLIEEMRQLHQEIDEEVNKCVLERTKKPHKYKDRLLQEYKIRKHLDTVQKNAKQLLEYYKSESRWEIMHTFTYFRAF